MKVLILHPDFKDPGGVAKYYLKLKNKFSITVDHHIIGKRPGEKGRIVKISRFFYDYSRFVRALRTNHYDVIHINPSLDFKSIFRDGIFAWLARLHGKKIVVFFHGWGKPVEMIIERYGLWLFKLLFGGANSFIVLAKQFENVLKSWGIKQQIYREVMTIDDSTFAEFDVNGPLVESQKSAMWRILFLSRVVKEKGIYETISAFSLLKNKYPNLELVVAGDGDELENAKSFVNDHAIPNVSFPGYVNGEDKNRLYKSSHIFCFPTYYGEGLPNTIVESMAFGLPIVTRPVGGIADFFKNGEHGFLTNSQKPKELANLIERLLVDRELYRKISLINYQYAQLNFLASQAALRLEKIYKSLLAN